MERIYFDNASTTKPSDAAVSAAIRVMNENYGNTSSLHMMGLEAEKEVKAVCKIIGSVLHCKPEEIIYTSGGTESNNTAIISGALLNKARGKRIITTKAEHPSVLQCFNALEKDFDVIYLDVDKHGEIDKNELLNVLDDAALVSLAHVNSETGVIHPVSDIVKLVKRENEYTLFHCDAAQSFCKIPVSDIIKSGVDYLTLSAHKIHGLKGIGGLYIKNGAPVKPIILGGGHQGNRRSGTENTYAVAAFGQAVLENISSMSDNFENAYLIKNKIISCLSSFEYIEVNQSGYDQNNSPFILNISITGVRSEVMLHELESHNIFVSAGSACSSRQKTSSVLTAYGLPRERTESAIRLSFSRYNTIDEADRFIDIFTSVLPRLRKYGGLKR